MDSEKKIKIQQKMIESLTKENQHLKERNAELESNLEVAAEIPKQGYDEAKKAIQELEEKIQEYTRLIKDIQTIKESYNDQKNQLEKMITEYKRNMHKTIRSIKKYEQIDS